MSIVLPTYNGSSYLRKSIQSILDQTFEDWELIVVDDCSTDDTGEIVRSFNDPRIHYTRNGANCKLPRSLNRGFALASGEYLTWTSDDNWYAPDALEKMTKILDTRSDIDLVCTYYQNVDEQGNSLGRYTLKPSVYLAELNTVGACFLHRRRVWHETGAYDPDKILVEDYDFWLRVNNKFRIALLEEDLYYYRQHGSSLTGTEGSKRITSIAHGVRQEPAYRYQRVRLRLFKLVLRLSRMKQSSGWATLFQPVRWISSRILSLQLRRWYVYNGDRSASK